MKRKPPGRPPATGVAGLLGLLALALSAGCTPGGPPTEAGARKDTRSPVWPQLLAHCLRSPDCDPMAGLGQGAGEASDQSGEVSWFAEAAGASVSVSLAAVRGRGGEAGRVLSIDEQPDSLAGHLSRRSVLMLRFEAGSGEPMALSGVSFRSAWVEPSDAAARDYSVEISGRAGVLLRQPATAAPAPYPAGMPGLSPVIVTFRQPARDAAMGPLLAAMKDEESLTLKIMTPAGAVLLFDVMYALGFEEALRTGRAALADPEIAASLSDRCARFVGQADAFWSGAELSPALRVCDPRLPQERRRAPA